MVLNHRVLLSAALLFMVSCSEEERSRVELTTQDVGIIAERTLRGVVPGMSAEEVRIRLQRYCLVQESANPRGGDLLLVFENINPCERDLSARLRARDQTTLPEACLSGTNLHVEQMGASGGGFSIVFNHGIVVTATAICHLQPGASSQTAQALLAQLLGRNLELLWSSDGQLGLLPEPTFALFGDRKIYLRYKISEDSSSGGTIFFTLSRRSSAFLP